MDERTSVEERAYQAGLECIDEVGVENFDFRQVAEKMQVFYGSLNTVIQDDPEQYHLKLAAYVARSYHDAMLASFEGLEREEAVRGFARAYMDYARRHRRLFTYLCSLPGKYKGRLPQFEFLYEEPYEKVLAGYALSRGEREKCICLLRSLLSGAYLQFQTPFFVQTGLWFEDALQFMLDHFLSQLSQCEAAASPDFTQALRAREAAEQEGKEEPITSQKGKAKKAPAGKKRTGDKPTGVVVELPILNATRQKPPVQPEED